ncbi:MAG: J domain-containing protein [Bacteroidales bacterium]|nr:J domain-containing protein [Bacteroidales bacterium]
MIQQINHLKTLLQNNKYKEAEELADSIAFFDESNTLTQIRKYIHEKNYSLALHYINQYISTGNNPDNFENIDLIGLQTTYQLLKTQFLVLNNQKTEAEKLIAQFRIRYYQELGFLISDILKERIKLFEKIKDTNPDQEFEYQRTQEQHQKFFQQWEHIPKEIKGNIDEETKQKITFAYRKASKLCHPDLVDDSIKDKASKIFVQLNKAYIDNDLETIEQILYQLENGLLEPDESILQHHKKLKAKINQLKNEITQLKQEMEAIKNSSSYAFIVKLSNWDEYFATTKEKLLAELKEIQNYAKLHSTSTI